MYMYMYMYMLYMYMYMQPSAPPRVMARLELSDEAKALFSKRGWDTGYVVFGAAASESTVKVLTATCLVLGKEPKIVEVCRSPSPSPAAAIF